MWTVTVVAIVVIVLTACAAPPSGEWVDLTHDFADDTIVWPTSERFRLETVSEGYTERGYYYAANAFATAEHGGTHVDAPIHFAAGRRTVDEIPLSHLIGDGVVVDVSAACRAHREHQVGVDELVAWEADHGRIPDGAIVLLRTGFDRFWPDAEAYMGTSRRGEEAVAELRFPGLGPDAARWLVEQRRIAAVGIDTPSIDHGPSVLFEAHQVLAGAQVPVFENVARLDRLPARGALIVALPMKIRGGSGAPLRIVARLP